MYGYGYSYADYNRPLVKTNLPYPYPFVQPTRYATGLPKIYPMQAIHNVLNRNQNPYITEDEWEAYKAWRRNKEINSNPIKRPIKKKRRQEIYKYINKTYNRR